MLFGSIITYSLANIACGLVQDPDTYKIIRFIAGVGLAGELGAGITLVSESIPKHLRALGTSLVAGVGLLGAVVAYFTVDLFDWRTAYFVGGGMGIALLFLRIGVFESSFYKNMKSVSTVQKGNFFALFSNKARFVKYLKCIGVGLPTWFVIGILITFSNEFGKAVGAHGPIDPGLAIMWSYIGLSVGDLSSGFFSHYLESRKKAVFYFLLFSITISVIYLFAGFKSVNIIYVLTGLLGLGNGYWALFVTIGAEQFGTNLRATVATTVPNMVRGSTVLMTSLFVFLKQQNWSVVAAAAGVGLIVFALSMYSAITIPETHGKDLDYLEVDHVQGII